MSRLTKIIVFLFLPFLILHIIVRFLGKSRLLYDHDQSYTIRHRHNPFRNKLLQFAYFIVLQPEYRSVFYRRSGLMGRLMRIYLPGQRCLYNRTLDIGGGLCINHGHSTEINADRIGRNCIIFQNVIIGTAGDSHGPIIGDNCCFGAGCVVLGHIHIGNNVK